MSATSDAGRSGRQRFSNAGFAEELRFSPARGWIAAGHLAIDQGPIVVIIENHRSGLLWNLCMSCPEVQAGLRRLGFRSPHLDGTAGPV